jgi:toxin ParE1/3/4
LAKIAAVLTSPTVWSIQLQIIIFLLSKHPQLGRRRDHDLRPGLRSLSVGGYVVIYRIENQDVVVLHVLHGRRDIKALF